MKDTKITKVFRPNFKRTIDGVSGLAVVVIIDVASDDVLTVAFTNEKAWRMTLATGLTTLYSTSRGKLWTKGEQSGNTQKVVGMFVDCDGDALTYIVDLQGDGVACHTEAYSCFYRPVVHISAAEPAPKAGPSEELELEDVFVHDSFLK